MSDLVLSMLFGACIILLSVSGSFERVADFSRLEWRPAVRRYRCRRNMIVNIGTVVNQLLKASARNNDNLSAETLRIREIVDCESDGPVC